MKRLLLLALLVSCTPKTDTPDGTDEDGDGYLVDVDCDDADAEVHPDASERCNEVDDDCDTEIDEGLDHTFYADVDGDGYGDANAPSEACRQPVATVTNADDCDDGLIAVNPGAAEVCDEIDNNCSGEVDEGVGGTVYVDADGDGHGDAAQPLSACAPGDGEALVGDDCDDTDPAVNPSATETDCTDIADYNCDGVSPFVDADGDGYATCADCDDADVAFSPDAVETCNDLDDDCDGEVDEAGAEGGTVFYLDYDGDGYGDASVTTSACDAPAGYVATGGDCNDDHRGVNPGTPEICDGFDDDCDGLTDEVC